MMIDTQVGHILVVDDNVLGRKLLARALEEQGHSVVTAANGQQALELLTEHDPSPFDLILLDILMPEMDGYQMLETLKQHPGLRHLPVIMISAIEDMDSVIRCIEAGATDYLPKPFNPALLRARINASLAGKRLHDNEQKYLKSLARELEIGREIQADFLPAELPQIPGWELAVFFKAARDVAGDFYDAFPVGRDHIALIVGDVCDKGVGAALYMALFRSLLRATFGLEAQAQDAEAIEDVVPRLKHAVTLTNDYVARVHEESTMFATLFAGILAPASGELMYINAGHEKPLIAGGGVIKARLKTTGPVIGLFPDTDFKVAAVTLDPGDVLAVYSDGLPDATNESLVTLDNDKVEAVLLRHSEHSAEEVSSALARLAQDHIGEADPFDDITLLVAHRTV
jgi:serine phosphatase RsbU (regulator of sigma subunit)